jgi:hypothetical protein
LALARQAQSHPLIFIWSPSDPWHEAALRVFCAAFILAEGFDNGPKGRRTINQERIIALVQQTNAAIDGRQLPDGHESVRTRQYFR